MGGGDYPPSSAALHVFFEGAFEFGGPAFVRSVVVEDDGLVLAEVRFEAAEVAAGRRSGHDVHLKQARIVEFLFQHERDELPLVIGPAALAVQNHDSDGSNGA